MVLTLTIIDDDVTKSITIPNEDEVFGHYIKEKTIYRKGEIDPKKTFRELGLGLSCLDRTVSMCNTSATSGYIIINVSWIDNLAEKQQFLTRREDRLCDYIIAPHCCIVSKQGTSDPLDRYKSLKDLGIENNDLVILRKKRKIVIFPSGCLGVASGNFFDADTSVGEILQFYYPHDRRMKAYYRGSVLAPNQRLDELTEQDNMIVAFSNPEQEKEIKNFRESLDDGERRRFDRFCS